MSVSLIQSNSVQSPEHFHFHWNAHTVNESPGLAAAWEVLWTTTVTTVLLLTHTETRSLHTGVPPLHITKTPTHIHTYIHKNPSVHMLKHAHTDAHIIHTHTYTYPRLLSLLINVLLMGHSWPRHPAADNRFLPLGQNDCLTYLTIGPNPYGLVHHRKQEID